MTLAVILHSLTPDQSKLTWFWVYFVKALALFLFVSHRDALTATHLQSAKIKTEQHHSRDFFWETWWKITTFCLYRDFYSMHYSDLCLKWLWLFDLEGIPLSEVRSPCVFVALSVRFLDEPDTMLATREIKHKGTEYEPILFVFILFLGKFYSSVES